MRSDKTAGTDTTAAEDARYNARVAWWREWWRKDDQRKQADRERMANQLREQLDREAWGRYRQAVIDFEAHRGD